MLTAVDGSGSVTPVLPLLSCVTLSLVFRRSRMSVLDRRSWQLALYGVLIGLLGYAAMAAGFALHHPLVVILFVTPYPILIASQYSIVRSRTIRSQVSNVLDAAAVACIGMAALFQWILPILLHAGRPGWKLFVSMVFPVLDIVSASFVIMFCSMLKWRLPKMYRNIACFQSALLLSDLLPAVFPHQTLAFGWRIAALGFVFAIAAARSDAGWSIDESASSSKGMFIVVWSVAGCALVALVTPETATASRVASVAALLIVGVRLSWAYLGAQRANDARAEARIDDLTGLGNRLALRESLDRLVGEGQPFSVLLLDLDDFKTTNESLGHEAGDQMLRIVAARLRRVGADHGRSVELFRLGGDEYVVLVTEGIDGVALARSVAVHIAEPTRVANERIDQRVSIGIAKFPDHSRVPSDLLRLADTVMYQAKQNRTGVEVHRTEESSSINQLRVTSLLRNALADGSFELYYQPKVSVTDGSVVGVEALFRLPHEGQYISAATVIAAAEQAMIVRELTDGVLDRAFRELSSLLRSQPELTVSVNASEQDFSSGTLAGRVLKAIEKYRLRPSQVCVEVTEEAVLNDPACASLASDRLREAGVLVSMDDFGVGFSSLTNLRTLAVDEVKIDRSFVSSLTTGDVRTEAVLLGIVDLIRRLDAVAVIEGVETAAQVRAARALGIEVVQGFVFARAMPLSGLERWLVESKAMRLELAVGVSEAPVLAG